MNKEVNYVLQGFLLTLVVVGAFKFTGLLLSIPPPPEAPKEITVGMCGNAIAMGPSEIKGRSLFLDNCAACHSLFKDMTGPFLMRVEERVKDRKVLYAWIRNSSAVLKSGDPYFNGLVKNSAMYA